MAEARPTKDAARSGEIQARMLFSGLRGQISELAGQLRDHLPVLALFSAALFAGGLLFAWSGVYSVAATSGHYPFFRVFLGYALERSVATQLELWMKGVRGGRYEGQLARVTAHAVAAPPDRASANAAVWSMTPEQMRAVALHDASLPPAGPAAAVAEARKE